MIREAPRKNVGIFFMIMLESSEGGQERVKYAKGGGAKLCSPLPLFSLVFFILIRFVLYEL